MKLPNVPIDEYAPAKLETSTQHSWFNRYGGYIIESRWNPSKKTYDERWMTCNWFRFCNFTNQLFILLS